jgi:porphobilinogen synthase
MPEEKYYSNQRRLRANPHIRQLASTVTLSHLDFIQPLFVDESVATRTPISTLSGVNSDTVESVIQQIEEDLKKGISKFLLFPVPKDRQEKNFNFNFAIETVKKIKSVFSDRIWLAMDVCLCSYTSHGHCGILNVDRSRVLNDETATVLADYSLQLAQAGADCIAPSDMMDGRIKAIRDNLNQNGFDHVAILSYSAKFSSAYYGPFRDACKSTPGKINILQDRKTYQLSPFNSNDAINTALRDLSEEADILMVKPALLNVDILHRLRQLTHSPLAAYHVSGEYQSIELLAQQNSIQRHLGHLEVWITLKRAGADCIISYASRFAKEWIEKIEY